MGGDQSGDAARGDGDTAFGEVGAQFIEGATDAFFGGVFAGAERGADFAEGAIFKITQDEGVAFVIAEASHGFIEQRSELLPADAGLLVEFGLHVSLLLAVLAAGFAFAGGDGDKSRGAIEPAGQNGFGTEPRSFAGEDDEDGLGDFFGEFGAAKLS